jgi:hypothetical protein
MARGDLDLHIPNEHHEDIGAELLRRILTNGGILEEYLALRS